MRWLAILALLLCSCGIGADGHNVYTALYLTGDYDGYTVEREAGKKMIWIHDEPYWENMRDALLTHWPEGFGSRGLRVYDEELWVPAHDAVEAANETKGWDAYPAPTWNP